MQDHYLHLGLDPEAGSAEIVAALEARPELSAAADILLNERRRGAYQRTVSTLRSIGILRNRLGLDNEQTWFVETCPDFAPKLHTRKFTAQPAADAAVDETKVDPEMAGRAGTAGNSPVTPTGTDKSAQSPAWLKPLLIALIMAALLVLLIVVL